MWGRQTRVYEKQSDEDFGWTDCPEPRRFDEMALKGKRDFQPVG